MSLPWRKKPKGDGSKDESDPSKPQEETNGLFVLSESLDSEGCLVDVIAIHGLGGDPYRTWTDNGHLWLRDFLPHQVPNVRVMTFGYDAAVAFSKSIASIEEYSLDLLNRLLNERETEQERARPIIFICHSLGGIVMKKSLIIANERTTIYGNILEKTKGVLFLGTPHRGSDVAYWTQFAARILRTAQLGTKTNSDLLNLLKRNSKALADISQQFVQRSAGLQIYTFYETEKLDYMKDLIVDKDSALLGLLNEQQVPMTATHRTMCKFADKESHKYRPIWKSIYQMVKTLTESSNDNSNTIATTEEYQKCLEAIFLTEPEDDYSSVRHAKGSRLEGTCEWIQDVEAFADWLKAPGWQLLLIIGEPGIGKTMIATYVIDDLQKRSEQLNDVIFAYYFCDNKDEKRRSAQAILRSLLLQILRQRPDFFPSIASDFKTQGTQLFSSSNSIYALWRITTSIFKSSTPCTIIFVVDAIDECDDQSQEIFLELLQEAFTEATEFRDVKFLITSRRTSRISHLKLQDRPFLRSLKVDNGRVNSDLSRFIDARVESLAKYRYSSKRRRAIATILKSRALGTFLWVSLVIGELSKTLPSLSDKILDRMPEKLVELYDKILDQIKPEHLEIVKNILLWVVHAFRPLSVAEMAIATRLSGRRLPKIRNSQDLADSTGLQLSEKLSSDEDSSSAEEDEVAHAELKAELELCPLIKFDEGTVYLIHQSAKDYLVDKGILTGILPSEKLANFRIFQSCTEYLSLKPFDDSNELIEMYGWDPLEIEDFFRYSCHHWSEHAQKSHPLAVDNTEWTSNAFILDDTKMQTFYNIFHRLVKRFYRPPIRGRTLLHVLAALGLSQFVDVLLSPAELQAKLHQAELGGKTALHLAAAEGHLDMVKLLVSKGSAVNVRDSKGNTALIESCLENHYEVAKFLLQNGSDVQMLHGAYYNSALALAIKCNNLPLTELILQHGCDPDTDGNALRVAIETEDPQFVTTILDHGAEIFDHHFPSCGSPAIFTILCDHLGKKLWHVCSFHEAAISQAARLKHLDIAQFLELTSRCGCERVSNHLSDALYQSATYLDAYMMNLLLAAWKQTVGGLPNLELLLFEAFNSRLFWGSSATEAVRSEYNQILSLLVDHGVNLNHRHNNEKTALSLAITRGDIADIHMLLDKGAIMQVSDVNNAEDWYYAANRPEFAQWTDLVNLILSKGFNLNKILERALMISIDRNNLKAVHRLLCASACSIKCQTSQEHMAKVTEAPSIVCSQDNISRTSVKLDETLDLSCSEVYVERHEFLEMFEVATGLRDAKTGLYQNQFSIKFGSDEDVLKFLHESAQGCGSHLNNHDESVTALVNQGRVSMARALIESGWANHPTLEVCSKAIYFSGKKNEFESAKFFLDLGGNPSYQVHGGTALYEFCDTYEPNLSSIQLLIGKGADVNAAGGEYGCPLGTAARYGSADVVRALLQHGADVDGPQDRSLEFKTPLWHAAKVGSEAVMIALLQAGANANALLPDSTLLISTYHPKKYLKTVELLLDHGANCQLTDKKGQTLLHLAVQDGRLDIVMRLLQAEADPDAKDHSGTSARDLADLHDHIHIQKFFSAYPMQKETSQS